MTRWLIANEISLHTGKTECVLFNSHKRFDWDFKVKIGGSWISPSKHIKYLGMLIDPDLNFGPQINVVTDQFQK